MTTIKALKRDYDCSYMEYIQDIKSKWIDIMREIGAMKIDLTV